MLITYGKIRIRPKNLIYIVLILTLLMGTLNDDFGVTTNIRYLNDVATLLLMFSLFFDKKIQKYIPYLGLNKIIIAMLVYTLVNIISIIINMVSVSLVVWAVRNTYRFFVFFWACIVYLEKEDLDRIFEIMYKIQWANVVLIFYQFTVLNLKQDDLGGIFGHGGNAGLLIYSVLLLAYAVSKYVSKEYSMFKVLFVLISTCVISVLAEIRAFFVFALIIVIVNAILNKSIIRKTGVILVSIILFFVAVDLYSKLFPYVSLTLDAFIKEGSSTGGGYNISRFNALSEINRLFFKNDNLRELFGFGFGNCEYSNIPLFRSKFYDLYGSYNYRWFTSQWVFLETGYAGVVSYIGIVLFNLSYSIKILKLKKDDDKVFKLICIILSIVCIISFFYNSLLKADFGYIAFFSLAISGIVYKEEKLESEK